jgi:hypothetical protein
MIFTFIHIDYFYVSHILTVKFNDTKKNNEAFLLLSHSQIYIQGKGTVSRHGL